MLRRKEERGLVHCACVCVKERERRERERLAALAAGCIAMCVLCALAGSGPGSHGP